MTQTQLIKNLSVPTKMIDVVLDTDAYNEIDDQFAIAYMLHSKEKLNVREIYAAPFYNQKSSSPEDGMERSYNEILNLLRLDGREDLIPHVYRGSPDYLKNEKEAVDSPAARALVSIASKYSVEEPLYVVAIGAITNVASAILLEPSISENIVLVWLGGNSLESDDTSEFNMRQDIAAARIVFGCGVPLVQLPCGGVVDIFRVSGPELKFWLSKKNALSNYLSENAICEAESYASGKPWTRVIWDVTAVAWLLNDDDRFMKSRLIASPIPEYDLHYAHNSRRHFIRYITHINRDSLMDDLFFKLTK